MDFDKIIKESIDDFLLESNFICEQVDLNQQIQQLMQQMQMTQDPNQKAQIMQQIQALQMQQQQAQQPQQEEDPNKGNPLAAVGMTPGAAGEAIGGEVLSRAATHAVDYAGDKLAAPKNALIKGWKNLKPGTRSGLKWGGAALGVAAGGYALLKMKKKACQNKCYERFTDQNQINDCIKIC